MIFSLKDITPAIIQTAAVWFSVMLKCDLNFKTPRQSCLHPRWIIGPGEAGAHKSLSKNINPDKKKRTLINTQWYGDCTRKNFQPSLVPPNVRVLTVSHIMLKGKWWNRWWLDCPTFPKGFFFPQEAKSTGTNGCHQIAKGNWHQIEPFSTFCCWVLNLEWLQLQNYPHCPAACCEPRGIWRCTHLHTSGTAWTLVSYLNLSATLLQ